MKNIVMDENKYNTDYQMKNSSQQKIVDNNNFEAFSSDSNRVLLQLKNTQYENYLNDSNEIHNNSKIINN